MKKYYSDRVTLLFVSPAKADEILVHEVTLEDTRREQDEMVDFDTVAWCPDQASAERIAKALNALDEVEEWVEGDPKERSAADLIRDVVR